MFYFNVLQKMEKTDFLGKVQHGVEKSTFFECKVCVCVCSPLWTPGCQEIAHWTLGIWKEGQYGHLFTCRLETQQYLWRTLLALWGLSIELRRTGSQRLCST